MKKSFAPNVDEHVKGDGRPPQVSTTNAGGAGGIRRSNPGEENSVGPIMASYCTFFTILLRRGKSEPSPPEGMKGRDQLPCWERKTNWGGGGAGSRISAYDSSFTGGR